MAYEQNSTSFIPVSPLKSQFRLRLVSHIPNLCQFVSLTDCYELGWIWHRKGEMWEEWRLKARRSSDYEVDVFPHCLIGDCGGRMERVGGRDSDT